MLCNLLEPPALASARRLHGRVVIMNHTPPKHEAATPIEIVTPDQLAHTTGGGFVSQVASMFGANGAKWGGMAETLISMVRGGAS